MTREKLQKYIFILLLVLLPTQLGLHFWPEWSYINGIRVDYFSPTLYLTDVLIGVLWLLERPKISLKLIFLIFLAAFNVYFSLSPAVSAYKWLKVAEIVFLVWFVARRAKFEAKWLVIPVFYESWLAIWQWWQQGAVGGFWYWLGERTFNSGTPGIANAAINGQLTLRPYGTFPHPNVLGGWLAVVLPLILIYFLHNSRRINAARLYILLIVVLGYGTLFLSLSRTAILIGVAATLWILGRKAVLLLIPLLLLWPRFLTAETEPVVARSELNRVAIEEFTRSPIWGTGLGTSPLYGAKVQNYALAFQPTHNIYLLVLAEAGVLGWLFFGFLLLKTRINIFLAVILFLGLFDHYFLTLQQGQLLLALILGLAWGRMKKSRKLEGW